MTEDEYDIYYRQRQEYKERAEEKRKLIKEYLEHYKPRIQ